MKKQLEQVREFNKSYGHPAPDSVTDIDQARRVQRGTYLNDEVFEFMLADGIVSQVKENIDLVYFALGNLVENGVSPDQIEAVFDAVHESNMAKRWPDGSIHYHHETGKVIKPDDWEPPTKTLAQILSEDCYIYVKKNTDTDEWEPCGQIECQGLAHGRFSLLVPPEFICPNEIAALFRSVKRDLFPDIEWV